MGLTDDWGPVTVTDLTTLKLWATVGRPPCPGAWPPLALPVGSLPRALSSPVESLPHICSVTQAPRSTRDPGRETIAHGTDPGPRSLEPWFAERAKARKAGASLGRQETLQSPASSVPSQSGPPCPSVPPGLPQWDLRTEPSLLPPSPVNTGPRLRGHPGSRRGASSLAVQLGLVQISLLREARD